MSLVQMIDRLVDEIGSGIGEATIRNRLLTMREQAEALDSALKKSETALEECNSALHDACADLERLKTNAQAKNVEPKTDLEEDSIRVLQLLFQQPMTLSQIASALNISKGMAEYHRDVLRQAKMISLPGIITRGRENPYHLLPKGREYLVKNKLV